MTPKLRQILPAVLLPALLAGCRPDDEAAMPDPLSAEAIGGFCQMDRAAHPGPKAQVHLEGLPGQPLCFARVRDAVAYSRLPGHEHAILSIWVSDMGAPGASWQGPGRTTWIRAGNAHYVVGATGKARGELVPFTALGAAEAFARAQGGSVMDLVTIPDSAVRAED